MYTILITFLACALSVFAGLSINEIQTVSSCAPVNITWQRSPDPGFPNSGATPFTLEVLDASDPCGDALFTLGHTNSTSYKWAAPPLAAGKQIIFSVQDKSGLEVWGNTITVKTGTTTSCLAATVPPATTPVSSSGGGSISGNVPVVNPEGAVSGAGASHVVSGTAIVVVGLMSALLL